MLLIYAPSPVGYPTVLGSYPLLGSGMRMGTLLAVLFSFPVCSTLFFGWHLRTLLPYL